MAQSVEHVIGNDEVISSILITSSKSRSFVRSGFCFPPKIRQRFWLFFTNKELSFLSLCKIAINLHFFLKNSEKHLTDGEIL